MHLICYVHIFLLPLDKDQWNTHAAFHIQKDSLSGLVGLENVEESLSSWNSFLTGWVCEPFRKQDGLARNRVSS